MPSDCNGPTAIDDDALWSQLQNTVALVAKEDQIIWTIFGIFWAANALLLAALYVQGAVAAPPVVFVIATAGTVLSLIWAVVQSRALRFLSFYERVQSALEARLLPAPNCCYALSRNLNKATFDQAPGTSISARLFMQGSSIGCTLAWLLAMILARING